MAPSKFSISDFPLIDKASGLSLDGIGGVILMDKPMGWSSFDVVKFVRNRVNFKKVGHAGTLDPLATGLLICCCGKATKTISQFQDLEKEYITTITFGGSTPSYDTGTEVDETAEWKHIQKEDIERVLKEQFLGEILQKPPVYSALQKNGKRLYTYARKGQDVEIEPRPVRVYEICIEDISMPQVTLKITCGKGTYIRSIAHDLALALHSRGHVSQLRRTRTGQYNVIDAYEPIEFQQLLNN